MGHRYLVVGSDVNLTEKITSSLSWSGQVSQLCASTNQTVAIAQKVKPSVILICGDLGTAQTKEWIVHLALEPQTGGIPLIGISPPTTPTAGIAALESGLCGLFSSSVPANELVRKIEEVVGPTPGHPLSVAALNHGGPATLHRIAAYLRQEGATATVDIKGASAPAQMSFVDGKFADGFLGDVKGKEAAQKLLTAPPEPWRFRLAGVDDSSPKASAGRVYRPPEK